MVLGLNPYKRRLLSDVTFVTVLCAVRSNMYLGIHVIYLCLFCYLFIMLSN